MRTIRSGGPAGERTCLQPAIRTCSVRSSAATPPSKARELTKKCDDLALILKLAAPIEVTEVKRP